MPVDPSAQERLEKEYTLNTITCVPVRDAIKLFFETQCKTQVKTPPPRFFESGAATEVEVALTVNLVTESWTACVFFLFSKKFFLSMCNRMLSESWSEMNREVEDAAREMGNLLSHQIVRHLKTKSENARALLPVISLGEHPFRLIGTANEKTIHLPFETDFGSFDVHIATQGLRAVG